MKFPFIKKLCVSKAIFLNIHGNNNTPYIVAYIAQTPPYRGGISPQRAIDWMIHIPYTCDILWGGVWTWMTDEKTEHSVSRQQSLRRVHWKARYLLSQLWKEKFHCKKKKYCLLSVKCYVQSIDMILIAKCEFLCDTLIKLTKKYQIFLFSRVCFACRQSFSIETCYA